MQRKKRISPILRMLECMKMKKLNKSGQNSSKINSLYKQGLQFHQSNQFHEAEHCYKQVLSMMPDHADTLHFLGVLLHQKGNADEAIKHLKMAIKKEPHMAHYYVNLGQVYLSLNQYDFAIEQFLKVVKINSKFINAYLKLNSSFLHLGQFEQSLNILKQGLDSNPDSIELHLKLAQSLHFTEQSEEAILRLKQLLKKNPEIFQAHHYLGLIFHAMGSIDNSIFHYKAAIELNEKYEEPINNLGILYMETNRYLLAEECFQRLLKINPESIDSMFNLAGCYLKSNKQDKARELYQVILSQTFHYQSALNSARLSIQNQEWKNAEDFFALILHNKPESADAIIGLGEVYIKTNFSMKSFQLYKEYLIKFPEDYKVLNAMGVLCFKQGHLESALEFYKRSLNMIQTNSDKTSSSLLPHHIASNELFCLTSIKDMTPHRLFKSFSNWGKMFSIQNEDQCWFENLLNPEKKLKIGYFSPDFRFHSAASVFQKFFDKHNREMFEIIALSEVKDIDEGTHFFKAKADKWIDTFQLSDKQLAQTIRELGIDILVDLAGHTENNRLIAFSAKPAPIMITGLGFGHTTGLTMFDYHISDRYVNPPSCVKANSEKVLYTKSQIRWSPPESDIELLPPPYFRNNFITFGSGHALFKINSTVIKAWSRILHETEHSILFLKCASFDDEYMKDRIIQEFKAHNIVSNRLVFEGKTNLSEHLKFYNQIDIALDTFPYHGGITLCETCWMGTPTISIAAGTGARGSILSILGYEQWIAHTVKEYIELAVGIAKSPEIIYGNQNKLRDKLVKSCICNDFTFTRELENCYRTVWRKYCYVRNN